MGSPSVSAIAWGSGTLGVLLFGVLVSAGASDMAVGESVPLERLSVVVEGSGRALVGGSTGGAALEVMV